MPTINDKSALSLGQFKDFISELNTKLGQINTKANASVKFASNTIVLNSDNLRVNRLKFFNKSTDGSDNNPLTSFDILSGVQYVAYSNNTLNFYDVTRATLLSDNSITPIFSIDLPKERFLDQVTTKFVTDFNFNTWADENLTAEEKTNFTNPNLNGKAVLVMGVKSVEDGAGNSETVTTSYSFVNLTDLIDIYIVKTDGVSEKVLDITNNEISFKISADADNSLIAKNDGLFVDLSDKIDKASNTTINDIVIFSSTDSAVTDSGISINTVAKIDTTATSAVFENVMVQVTDANDTYHQKIAKSDVTYTALKEVVDGIDDVKTAIGNTTATTGQYLISIDETGTFRIVNDSYLYTGVSTSLFTNLVTLKTSVSDSTHNPEVTDNFKYVVTFTKDGTFDITSVTNTALDTFFTNLESLKTSITNSITTNSDATDRTYTLEMNKEGTIVAKRYTFAGNTNALVSGDNIMIMKEDGNIYRTEYSITSDSDFETFLSTEFNQDYSGYEDIVSTPSFTLSSASGNVVVGNTTTFTATVASTTTLSASSANTEVATVTSSTEVNGDNTVYTFTVEGEAEGETVVTISNTGNATDKREFTITVTNE